uniref:SH3 domain-containing YSC84-like protein 1 n=1 Tax=Myxine glutinosa TaxID=7769 RepID=UPI0035901D97
MSKTPPGDVQRQQEEPRPGNCGSPCGRRVEWLGLPLQRDEAGVSDLVIVLNTHKAVEAFACGSDVTLGGNLTVSIGPLGRAVEADVAMRRTAAMFTYCRSRGLFAGISLEGAYLFQRKDANQKFYCENVRINEILAGMVEPPAVAQELYHQLSKYRDLADKHESAIARALARKPERWQSSNEPRRRRSADAEAAQLK